MHSKRQPGRPQRPPLIEELEPRLLLSADLPVAAPEPIAAPPELVINSDRIDVNQSRVGAEAAPTSALRREIAFVDAGVEGYQELVADLIGRRNAELQLDVFVLDAERDGIDQIGDVLARYAFDVDAVHVFSHGNDAGVQLGSTWLGGQSLGANADAISSWRSALGENADLLIYGCDLAGSSDGLALVDELANLTGADVAASTDLTGAAVLGGDWDLEHTTGRVEARIAVSADLQESWSQVLSVGVDATSTGTGAGSSATVSHTTTTATDRLMLVGVTIRPNASETVSSATYNGTPLSIVGVQNGPDGARVEIWSLVAPASGTHDLVVNLSSAGHSGVTVGVMTFTGVDPTTPLGAFGSASGDGTSGSAPISSATGELVFGVVSVKDTDQDLVPDTDQTERWDLFTGTEANGGGSTEAGSGSVNLLWTWSASTDWAIGGVSIKPSISFQEGVSGYVGTEDNRVTEDNPVAPQGSDPTLRVDASAGADDQGLIRFDNIFGTGPGQIPTGSTIQSASLTFEVTDASAMGATIGLYRMLVTWDESSNWNSLTGGGPPTPGIQLNDAEASSVADSILTTPDALGPVTFTGLAAALQSWLDGATNYGWAIVSNSTNGWVVNTSEHMTPALRPFLSVTYTPPPIADTTSDLVVHLTLDETSGSVATDRSGNANHGSLTGTQTWTPAQLSGGFQFDYTDGDEYFEIANSSTVENVQEGDFTLAAWVQPGSTPPGTGSDNDASYAIIVKEGFHTGLSYTNNNRYSFDHVLTGDVTIAVLTTSTFLPGDLHHVAGVIDRAAGTLQIYVDGVLEGTTNFTPGTASREYGTDTWKVGMAGQPGWGTYKWAADALIDDARIYARSLSETDVVALAGMPGAASLWITTEDDVGSPSDIPGADSFSGGTVLELGGSPTLEPGVTGGTFSSAFDLDAFVQDGDARLDAIHYVGTDLLLGSNGIAVQAGDVLLSSVFPETLVNSDTSTVAITSRDVFIYRPDTAGDYAGGGTFIPLIVGADLAMEPEGVTLIEQTVTVGVGAGATTLYAGDLLFTDRNDTGKIFRFLPGVLGDAATNTGTITTLVDANNLGVNQEIHGVEIIESAVTVADRTLYGGQILISTYADDTISGTPTERDDVVLLDITSTGPGASTTGSAEVLFQGADTGFDVWQESIWGVALRSTVTTNAAPVLTPGSPGLTAITEDETGNGGTLVSTILTGTVSDGDGDDVGIAVTGLSSGNGTWEYSLDGGGVWNAVGSVGASSALLLRHTDLLRFVPDGENGESPDPTVTYRAWDQSSGVAGTTIDPGAGGGSSAFSATSDSAAITVSSVNDAPVLVGVSPTLTGITEDDTGNGGDLVSTLLGGVSDVDTGAASGLAITSVTAVNGTWQYRLGAGAWTDVGAVSATSALLLASTDSVRFVPDGDNGGSSSFAFRAWDQTTGAAGTKVDPGIGGTTTAFSTGGDTAGITVTSVNDAPVLVGVSPTLTGITEDDTGNGGDLVSTLLGGVSDVDTGAASGLAITSVTAVNGTWQYRLGAGAWTDVGAVSATSALLLASTDSVRFVPDGDNGGSSSFTFRAWDQTTGVAGTKVDPGVGGTTTAFSTGGDTAGITVTSVNDAPVLVGVSPTLTGITEDDTGNGGDLVSTLLGGVSDVDTGAASGLAITSVTAVNGTWQYRLGAGAWTDVGAVSATSALLLASTDSVRFVPDGDNGGSSSFAFRAWDQTTGVAGTKVDPGVGGTTTAFSTGGDTAGITVTSVNDAPVLVGVSPTLTGITEDDTGNGGDLVSTLLGGVSDVDTGAASGLAITSVTAVNGTWQYRLGAGAWTDVGAVSATSALLLASTDSVRFVPDGDNGGSSSFAFRAWDQTTGVAGTKVDPGVGGTTTAFSTGGDTAGITVTSVNDAPVLVGVSPTLTGITEDDTGNGGDLVSTLLGGVSDVDTGAASGLAITSVTAVNGTWQYRLGAGAWTDVGAVSATSALLLASTDSVRFVPDGDNGGSSSFAFRAWDQTTGVAGTKVDPGVGGTTTAFSTGGDTAGITVTSVNDAPVLVGVSPTLTGITEDDTGNGGDLVSTLLGGVSDVDTGAASGLAITSVTAVNGTWQYRLGAGAWTDVGAVSATSALLLASTDSVRFVPDGDNGGSSSFAFRAWDQTTGVAGTKVDPGVGGTTTAFSTGGDTAGITVTSVNDAPVLVGVSPTLTGITEDDTGNGGDLVSTLLGGVSDVDTGAASGLAITSVTAVNGTWQYRLGAGAWTDVGVVSATSALLLASTDSVRFVPDGDNGGSSSFAFRAWDQTTGVAGTKVDPGVGGTTTAFSTGSDTAGITVTSVNDAPALDPSSNLVLTDVVEDDTNPPGDTVATILASDGGNPLTDVDTVFLEGIAVTGVDDTDGTWQYRLGAGSWTDVGAVSATSALLLRDTDGLRFVPDPAYNGSAGNIDFRGWDQTTGSAGTLVNPGVGGGTTAYSTLAETATLNVTAVNDAPVLTPASPTLTSVTEDDVANGGQTVSSIVGGSIADDDVGALEGIAITGLSASNGTWQYRVGAGAWTDIAPVTASSALLLASSDSVRFVPDGLNAGSGTFSYRAWDQTSGSAGTKLDPGVGGGSTAFSTASDTASITTTAVNDAPQLVGVSPTLPGITEDDTGNGGALVSILLGGVSDVDSGAASGLAITSVTAVNGTWQYRLGAGSWTDVGAVSATSALLLASTDSVRFVPDGDNGGSSSFDFRAWDRSAGVAGTKVDPGVGGSTTAFSTGSDTAGITVSAVNDSPVLVGVSPTLTGITEDDTTNGGELVSTLLGGVSDVDTGAASGLAITSVTAVNGTWQYRLGAGAWTDVGAVSGTSALLLASTDSVRFVPDADDGGSSSFDFRAWDQTSGAAGTKVNPGAGGTTTAFSTGSDTASITVSAVNDAPVLTPGAPSLPDGDEDTTPTFGTSVATLIAGLVTDVDPGSLQGITITSLSSGNGTWEFQLGGTTNPWNPIGVVSDANALLLRAVDRVRFVPDGLNADSASFDFRAWDQSSGVPGTQVDTVPNGGVTAFSTATDTASVTINAVNDAPVLTTAAPSFTGITEDDTANLGDTVASLLGGSVSDVDNGAVAGIAITGLVSGNGTWQYRVGAGAWIDVGAVSDANALVLQDTDRLRFVPDTLNGTNASVSYRAWDQSSGAAGSKVNASTAGGTTAFSTSTDTASIAVSAVNDQPTMADQGYGVDENAANGTAVGSAIANDVDLPTDALTWTLLAGNTGGAFLVDAATGQIRVANTAALDFEANPVFNLTVEVRDPGGLLDTATLTVSLNDVPESVLIPDTPPPVDPPPEPSEPPPPEDDPGDEPRDDGVATSPPVDDGDTPLTETLPPVSAPVPTSLRAPVNDLGDEMRVGRAQRESEPRIALESMSVVVREDDPLVIDSAMWEALDRMGRDFENIADSDSASTRLLIGTAEGASVAVVAGFLSWFLRGGTLLTSLLTTMPLWSRLDPVPVLDTDDEERERLCGEEEETKKKDLEEERANLVLGEARSPSENGRPVQS